MSKSEQCRLLLQRSDPAVPKLMFVIDTGIALVFGYGLLGTGWLVLKTEDDIHAQARRYGRICLAGVAIAILLVSTWTPLMNDAVSKRWFSWPNILPALRRATRQAHH